MENMNETSLTTTNTEIIKTGDNLGLPELNSDEEMGFFLEKVERRNKAIDEITRMALKKLVPTDFHDFDGKPFLQGTGAQRLIKYFGISVTNINRIPSHGYEHAEGDTANRLRVTFRALFTLGSMTVEGEGVRDTHNKFFGKTQGAFKDIENIELPDLDRAAKTAMYRDGVATLLGLKSMSWAYLKELGFTPDQTTGHTYGKGTKGGDMAGGDKDTKDLKTQIVNMIYEMAGQDANKSEDMLEQFTAWKEKGISGVRSSSKLTVKQTPVIYGKVKAEYEKWCKEQPAGQNLPPDESQNEIGF